MKILASALVRHRRLALWSFISIMLFSLIWGVQAFGNLKPGGYDDPGSDSTKVNSMLAKDFGQQDPEVVMLLDFVDGADTPAAAATASDISTKIAAMPGVQYVTSYYTLGMPSTLKSADGKEVYLFAKIADQGKVQAISKTIQDTYSGAQGNATVYVAGWGPVTSEINHIIEGDLTKAESFAIPVVILLLIFVFGSIVAAGLPLMVAGLTILGSFFWIWVLTQFSDTSTFAINLLSGLGLGLGIDYALLLVNRFREERNHGRDVESSVIATVLTAGRTVLFSGMTVIAVMLSMLFFPQYFLRTFAMTGVFAVSLAVLSALIALPALLLLVGDKINKGRIFKNNIDPDQAGRWASIARFVMRRPVAILLIGIIGLGSLAGLGMNIKLGQVDDRILPSTNRVVVASDQIRTRFDGREGSPVEILVQNASDTQVLSYAQTLAADQRVTRVQTDLGIVTKAGLMPGTAQMFSGYKQASWQRLAVIATVEPRSPEGETLVTDLRAIDSHIPGVLIGGSAAIYTDALNGISRQLPWATTWIVICVLIILFLFTGSVLLPIKAVLLNFMSLLATMGFLTWVFMSGNLKWLIGDFVVTGTIDSSSLVLVAVMSFGLSMDYELFLLSRIKEQHDHGLSTTESVAQGLQKSGRIITTAALVLAASFAAFATSSVSIMKMLGLGIAFAVIIDATVIRALLVPTLMKLFGKANWWAPKWLRKVHDKIGLQD